MTHNTITVFDIYRSHLKGLPIPEDFRVVAFRPPHTKDLLFSVISWTVVKATAVFHDLCPRLILQEVEPCNLCGDKEPLEMTEIKKSTKARTYTIMMLCAGCREHNKNFIKPT